MKAFKCPNCAGDVKYDIRKAVMTCKHCGSEIKRESYQAYLDENALYAANELVCPQCGAALLRSDDTLATFCCYCGSSVSFNQQTAVNARPDGIVPFSVPAEEALSRYRTSLKKAFFAPDQMLEDGEKKLIGIYMPYYAFTAEADEHIETVGIRKSASRSNAEEEYKLKFDMRATYSGIRFDAARAFPDFLSESIDNFTDDDYKGLKPFESSYLAGYYADGGNVGREIYADIVERIVTRDLTAGDWQCEGFRLKSHAKKPTIEASAKKNLYPVWLITHRWGDRVSYAAVNGQNGKTAVEIPTDKKKFLYVSLILAALLSLILNFLWTFPPLPFLLISGVLLLLMGLRLVALNRALYVRQQRLDDVGWLGVLPDRSKADVKRMYPSGVSNVAKRVLGLFFIGVFVCPVLFILSGRIARLFLAPLSFLTRYWFLIFIGFGVLCFLIMLWNQSKGNWKTAVTWSYWVPWKVVLKACWKFLLGLAMILIILLSGSVNDNLYYTAAILNFGLAVWSAIELFEARNLLMSRDIPVFTEKRGGDGIEQ